MGKATRIYTIGRDRALQNNGDNTFHYSTHAAKAKRTHGGKANSFI